MKTSCTRFTSCAKY